MSPASTRSNQVNHVLRNPQRLGEEFRMNGGCCSDPTHRFRGQLVGHAQLSRSVSHIVSMSSQEEVVRAHAGRGIAVVANQHSRRHRTIRDMPTVDVGQPVPSASPQESIAAATAGSRPQPAWPTRIDPKPEMRNWVYRRRLKPSGRTAVSHPVIVETTPGFGIDDVPTVRDRASSMKGHIDLLRRCATPGGATSTRPVFWSRYCSGGKTRAGQKVFQY